MMRLLRERPAAQPLLRRLALKRVRDAVARAYIAEAHGPEDRGKRAKHDEGLLHVTGTRT